MRFLPAVAFVIAGSAAMAAAAGITPAVLDSFAGPDVPAQGPLEGPPIPRNWPAPAAAPATLGGGIGRHPMLYAGEGYNTLFLVNRGQVTWTYCVLGRGEIDDLWLLSNGHVLFARQFHIEELTPTKKLVWHYDAPPGTEVHTCQPIGLDRVLFIRNGLPPRLMVVNKRTGVTEVDHALPAVSLTDPKTVHPQFRRVRMTAAGTFLVPFLKLNRVVEYDRAFHEIWSYSIPTPWAAVRLHNGNTLITDESGRLTREVTRSGATVWEFGPADWPKDLAFRNTQTAERLANGNTVIFSSTGNAKHEDRPRMVQAIEVTPAKKVVWVLRDWKDLGPATTAQFLDQPGIPEHPGDLQR